MDGATRWLNSQIAADTDILGFFQWTDRLGVKREVVRVPIGYHARLFGESSWTSVQVTPSQPDAVPMFVAANGKLFMVDGFNAFFWDGTGSGTSRFTPWARLTAPRTALVGSTPDDAPSASAISGSGLGGDNEFEVTFVFGDATSGAENKHSPPAPILRVRTTQSLAQIRIDTGYAGLDESTGTDPDVQTSYLHLPADVAAVGATNARIIGLISKANRAGAWYQADANGDIVSRAIPQTTTFSAQELSGQTVLSVTSTTNYAVGDQVVLSPGLSTEEVVRITAINSGPTTITVTPATSKQHESGDKIVPIISLIFDAAGLTDQYKAFFGPPAEATGLIIHLDSLWTWGSPNFPTRIWFTDPDAPETFNTLNFLDVDPDNPNDPIVSIVPFGKGAGASLLILRLNSVWRLDGNGLTSFQSQMIQEGPSCVGERAALQVPDGTIYWAGFEDLYRYDGATIVSVIKDRARADYRSSFGLVDVGGKVT